MTIQIRAAATLAAFLLTAPVQAQSLSQPPLETECRSEAPPPSQPPRRNPFGGLFAAARDAGLGQALVSGLAPAEGQAAAALLSGNAAGAVSAIPGARRDARTAQATTVAAGMAVNMARSARDARTEACAAAENDASPPASADVWQ